MTRTMIQIQRDAIKEALFRHNGNKRKAAEELGVGVRTLTNWINLSGKGNKHRVLREAKIETEEDCLR